MCARHAQHRLRLVGVGGHAGGADQVGPELRELARQRVFVLEPQVEHADFVTAAHRRRDRGERHRLGEPDDVLEPEPAVLERRRHHQQDAERVAGGVGRVDFDGGEGLEHGE